MGLPLTDEARRGAEEVLDTLGKKHWKVGWVPVEQLHITLAFLGEMREEYRQEVWEGSGEMDRPEGRDERFEKIEGEMADKILAVMAGVVDEVKPFELRFKGVNSFPAQKLSKLYGERMHGRSMKRLRLRARPSLALPRVIYLRLGGEVGELGRLASEVRKRLTRAKVHFDPKPFVPHVTLGRVRESSTRGERIEMAKAIGKLYEMKISKSWEVGEMVLYESMLSPGGSRYTRLRTVSLR